MKKQQQHSTDQFNGWGVLGSLSTLEQNPTLVFGLGSQRGASLVNYRGSTPIPRTVLKHSQTSHLAEQPFFSFEDYGIAQYSQINPLWQNPRLGNAFGLSVLF